jgi:hypothetical protein
VETDSLLRAPKVATISSAQPSQEVLAAVTVPPSSLPDLSENGPAIVDISRFRTIVEVSTLKVVNNLDRQSGPSGDEYECELEPVWFAADLVEKAQMGRFHIRAYESRLVRARLVGTLRLAKRTLEEMEAS